MKNIFFICMFGLLAFAGCSDNEEEILTGGNIDIDMLPPNQPNENYLQLSILIIQDWKKPKNFIIQGNTTMQ